MGKGLIMEFIMNDGGRKEVGFKGTSRDCACRAVAIATGRPYLEVYDDLNEFAKTEKPSKRRRGKSSARTGFHMHTFKRYMASIGWTWTATMKIGSGCKVHMNADELPAGTIIVRLTRHYATVIDGVLHDNHDCSRDGSRCVYGYWVKGNG